MSYDGVFAILTPTNSEAKAALDYDENQARVVTASFRNLSHHDNVPDGISDDVSDGDTGSDGEGVFLQAVTPHPLSYVMCASDMEDENKRAMVVTPAMDGKATVQQRCFVISFRKYPKDPHKGWKVGHAENCDLIVARDRTTGVSRVHFRIQINRVNGQILIRDRSKTGTVIFDTVLRQQTSAITRNFTTVQIGKHKYTLKFIFPNMEQYELDVRGYLRDLGQKYSRYMVLCPVLSKERLVVGGLTLHELARGSFGKVYMAVEGNFGNLRALKQLDETRQSKDSIAQEIAIAQRVSHSRVIQVKKVIREGPRVYLLMEWAPFGTLSSILEAIPTLEPRIVVIRQTMEGLEYLHSLNIVHRDLKPDNIVVVSLDPLSIKIIDFGLSKETNLLRTHCGTPPWLAPEIRPEEEDTYDKSVDIWSTGLISYDLLINERRPSADRQVSEGDYRNLKRLIRCMCNPKGDFLNFLIHWYPKDRPTASQCLAHLFLREEEPPFDSGKKHGVDNDDSRIIEKQARLDGEILGKEDGLAGQTPSDIKLEKLIKAELAK